MSKAYQFCQYHLSNHFWHYIVTLPSNTPRAYGRLVCQGRVGGEREGRTECWGLEEAGVYVFPRQAPREDWTARLRQEVRVVVGAGWSWGCRPPHSSLPTARPHSRPPTRPLSAKPPSLVCEYPHLLGHFECTLFQPSPSTTACAPEPSTPFPAISTQEIPVSYVLLYIYIFHTLSLPYDN